MPGPSLFIRQQVPNATSSNDGLMSASQAAAVAGIMPSVVNNQQIYVNAATGSDANPGTQTAPLQTFDAAWNMMVGGSGLRRIYLVAGTYPINSGSESKNYIVAPPAGTVNEPVTILGDTTVVETGAIGALVTTLQTGGRVFQRATPTTAQIGGALMFTSGSCTGVRLSIALDDGLQITLNNAPNAFGTFSTPSVGDTYIIERPASFIQVTGTCQFQGNAFAMKNVCFNAAASGNTLEIANYGYCEAVENVEFDMTYLGVVVFNMSVLRTASDDRTSLSPNPFSLALRRSCGLYVHGGSTVGFNIDQLSFLGQTTGGGIVVNNVTNFFVSDTSQYHQSSPGPCHINTYLEVDVGCTAVLEGTTSVGAIFQGSPTINLPPITLINCSATLRRMYVSGSLTDGIFMTRTARAYVDLVRGVCNQGWGVNVQAGSHIVANANSYPLGTPTLSTTGMGITPVGAQGATKNTAVTTTLSDSPLTASATTVNVAATTGFNATGTFVIDTGTLREYITYTGITGTSFTGCTRGAFFSTAQQHATGVTVQAGSGSDVLVGIVPQTYAGLIGKSGYAEPDNNSGFTLNRFSIKQGSF